MAWISAHPFLTAAAAFVALVLGFVVAKAARPAQRTTVSLFGADDVPAPKRRP